MADEIKKAADDETKEASKAITETKNAKKPAETKPKKAKVPLTVKVKNFFRDYKGEMKKVVWSPKKDVIKNTGVVLVVSVAVGVAVGLLDLGLSQLILLLGGIN